MKRKFHFDNAKLFLIILVVVGHYLERVIGDSTFEHKQQLETIYTLIYSFHMPAFIFMSGYFTRVMNWKKIVRRIVIPFVIFEVIYSLLYLIVLPQHKLLIQWNTPFWILWFLFSLALWSFMLPYLIKIKYITPITFILGVGAGYFDVIGYKFGLSRVIVFLPFFLLGYWMKNKEIKYLDKRIAYSLIFLISFFIYKVSPNVNWFIGSFSYNALKHPEWYGGLYRVITYTVSIIMIYLFLSVVRRTKNELSYLGKYTIYTYLLHGFFILIPQEYHLFDKINSLLLFFSILLLYIVLSFILMDRFSRKMTIRIIEVRKYRSL